MLVRSLVFLLFLSPLALSAQSLEFMPVGLAQGLDVKVATSVLVDRNGFLWVASREGLYRYDGYQATPMPTGKRGLPDQDIRALYEDRAGYLWVATNTSGVSRYDPRTNTFSHFRHQSADPHTLTHDSIYGMAEDAEGRLWAGSQIGLNRIDPVSGRVTRFRHDPTQPRALAHDYVYDVLAEPGGDAVWVATIGGGINRWQADADGFDHFDLAGLSGMPEEVNSVFGLARRGDTTLFAGTRAGLIELDFARGTARTVDLGGDEPPVIPALQWGPEGRLWVATMGRGVLIYDPVSGDVENANPNPLGSDGQLPALPQLSLHFSGGKLLVATWGNGVYMARLQRGEYGWRRAGEEAGLLRHHNVTAVMSSPERPLWVGSFGGGVQHLMPDGRFSSETAQAGDALYTDGVISLVERRSGQLLAGSNHGLWILDPDGRHRLIGSNTGEGLGEGYVTSLLESDNGELWVGVGGSGLFRLPAGHSHFTGYTHHPDQADSLSGNYITALLQVGENLLLVGTRSSGLNLCQMTPWQCRRFGGDQGLAHHNVTVLYRDRLGAIWAGTDGGGLHQFELGRDGTLRLLRRWSEGDGLLGPGIMGIVEDDDGSLWLSSRQGLTRLQPRTGALEHHVAESGLPVIHFNARAASRDRHNLYFGGIGGLITIPVGTAMAQLEASPVRLVDISRAAEGNALHTQPAMALESLELDWGEMLSVSFAALDFAKAPHQYQYRLQPTEAWQSLGPRRELTLLELSPGNYQLSVRGRDVFGRWGESPALSLNVVPPLWMTAWFRVLGVSLLLAAGFALHHYRMRGLQRRNRMLERLRGQRERALEKAEVSGRRLAQAHAGLRNLTARLQSAKEEQRQQISRELHDELGQNLTAAKISLQRVAHATSAEDQRQRVCESVSMLDHMIAQVRNISLTLRPPLLDDVGLVEALKVHLGSVQDRTGVDIGLHVDGGIAKTSRDVRTTIFRLVQEAVSNALRHAGCNRITVALEGRTAGIFLSVQDDGCGFDVKRVWERVLRGEHLGLLGLLERARSAGGELKFDAAPGRGCHITAMIPL
ncbi:two-component regulator propeller domain-containing protein [Microbulbifer sp.]|uniref:two-component regulator propeller domain-containing protein n=1 Tax=Microbulbifer sp. TaxID=1908541 RepID=UPI002F95F4F6